MRFESQPNKITSIESDEMNKYESKTKQVSQHNSIDNNNNNSNKRQTIKVQEK